LIPHAGTSVRCGAEVAQHGEHPSVVAALLTAIFDGVGLSARHIAELVDLTGADGRGYGYTYSDLVDRVLAATCLAAYPDRPITADLIAEQIRANPPTRPFAERQ
jgi:hypothetical protein